MPIILRHGTAAFPLTSPGTYVDGDFDHVVDDTGRPLDDSADSDPCHDIRRQLRDARHGFTN